MSEIKVNKISPATGTAIAVGDASDVITVPTGASFIATDEVKTNKISPASGTAFTLGDSGDTFTVPSGATILNSGTATGFGGAATETLIKSLTSDGSDTELEFVNGAASVVLDATYKLYCFRWWNIHAQTDGEHFGFLCSADAGSSYTAFSNTNSNFRGYAQTAGSSHDHGTGSVVGTKPNTSLAVVNSHQGNDTVAHTNGIMYLYNPAETVFNKHFHGLENGFASNDYVNTHMFGGIFLTTSAINAIKFLFSSGEIQAGGVSMYGITL